MAIPSVKQESRIQNVRGALFALLMFSVIIGGVLTVCSLGMQSFYNLGDCRDIVSIGMGYQNVPEPLDNCTGIAEGGPRRFIESDAGVTVRWKAQKPITVNKLDVFAGFHVSPVALIEDWFCWSAISFGVLYILYRSRTAHDRLTV